MRTTLILDVDEDIARFMEEQGATVDPSAFINKLVREEKQRDEARQCVEKIGKTEKKASYMDDRLTTLEQHLDEDTHAGG